MRGGAHRRRCLAQAGAGESSLVLLMVALLLTASPARPSATPLVSAASSATLHKFSWSPEAVGLELHDARNS